MYIHNHMITKNGNQDTNHIKFMLTWQGLFNLPLKQQLDSQQLTRNIFFHSLSLSLSASLCSPCPSLPTLLFSLSISLLLFFSPSLCLPLPLFLSLTICLISLEFCYNPIRCFQVYVIRTAASFDRNLPVGSRPKSDTHSQN